MPQRAIWRRPSAPPCKSGLERLNLVTREEFDVQRLVLLRSREKLEALEKRFAQLEAEQRSP